MASERVCPVCEGKGKVLVSAPSGASVTGVRLAGLMADAQMTQLQLAEFLGRAQTAVSYWVNGKRRPGYEDLVRIADLFGVSTDWLLGR